MKINKVCLLLIILLFPVIVLAEGKNTDVIYNVKAEITFNNQNIVITEKVSAGDKLSEPSHIDIDGYIFLGWFVDNHRWDFDNDVVTNHTTLTAKYKKTDGLIENVTDSNNNYMSSYVAVNADDIELSNQDKEALANGQDVVVWLEVNDITDTVEKSEASKITKFSKKKDLLVDSYFDIELFKAIEGVNGTTESIHETNNDITVTITIPEELRFFGRKYYILRMHDDVVDIVYSGYPGLDWKITFQTDSFSTYAIAHDDITNNGVVPNTSDSIGTVFIILLVSTLGIIMTCTYIYKSNNKKISE